MTEGRGSEGVGRGRLALRAQQRERDTEPNLLPSGASTFHPIVFFFLLSMSFASCSPLPRWSFGPLVWRRYKAIAHARLPSLWYWFCQNCHCIIFLVLCLNKEGSDFYFGIFDCINILMLHRPRGQQDDQRWNMWGFVMFFVSPFFGRCLTLRPTQSAQNSTCAIILNQVYTSGK